METQQILGAKTRTRPLLFLAAIALGGLLLSGCGQKGPLYLPTAPQKAAPGDKGAAPASNTTTDDEDEVPVTKR